jgi:hypothetical protein
MCTVRAGEAASWSVGDCASGTSCEIGIHTAAAHRRRGLAALTAAATVAQAAERGFARVGWHCPDYNLGSAATARRAGFELVGDHAAVDVWFRELDACLAHGVACLMHGRYPEAADWYGQARALADAGEPSRLLDVPDRRDFHWERAECAEELAGGDAGAERRLAENFERSQCRYYAV